MKTEQNIHNNIKTSFRKIPPKDIAFRAWRKEDIPAIAEMCIQLYHYIDRIDPVWRTSPWAKDHLRTHLYDLYNKSQAMTYVACKDRELIGFITGTIVRRSPVILPSRDGLVDNAYIKTSWRNKGIGTRLVQMLLDWFRSQGINEVRVYYQISNSRAAAFWERVGFKPWTMQSHIWLDRQ